MINKIIGYSSLLAATQIAATPLMAQDNFMGQVGFDSAVSYDMLDPTTNINRKQLYILEQKQNGTIKDGVIIGGAVTPIADYWTSNTENKFGYLMRHPTANNQIGTNVTEAVLHSAQFSFMANMGSWVTAYGELLYDPEQSFGSGTITDLNRNQVQLRKGYVTVGNLDKSPVWVSIGKMATAFALTDTVNPFSSSSNWHAFGGLAYGAKLGYSQHGLNITANLVQGGAQFRAANVPVNGTNIPSRANNYVLDVNYTFGFGNEDDKMLIGGSYEKGSAYCQGYPVAHFNACDEENPAWAVYGKLDIAQFTLIGEFIETTKEWAGTHNPTPPLNVFEARKVTSFTIGGKFETAIDDKRLDLSAEFSSFIAGAEGAPWQRQNQWVLGVAYFFLDNVKFFAEGIHTQGYVPLNFISGGSIRDDFGAIDNSQTHSVRDATSTGVILGVNAAF